MANTPPKPPYRERSDVTLLEELGVELRFVAVNDYSLPDGNRVKQHIQEVRQIYAELARRKLDPAPSLAALSKQTSWQIDSLLEDCLGYPAKQPYVKETDGIRRSLRCARCRKAERPLDAKVFWFCEACMNTVLSAVQQKTECDGVAIIRSYSSRNRCSHADSNTPLACEWDGEVVYGVCEICIGEEIARREKLPRLD